MAKPVGVKQPIYDRIRREVTETTEAMNLLEDEGDRRQLKGIFNRVLLGRNYSDTAIARALRSPDAPLRPVATACLEQLGEQLDALEDKDVAAACQTRVDHLKQFLANTAAQS